MSHLCRAVLWPLGASRSQRPSAPRSSEMADGTRRVASDVLSDRWAATAAEPVGPTNPLPRARAGSAAAAAEGGGRGGAAAAAPDSSDSAARAGGHGVAVGGAVLGTIQARLYPGPKSLGSNGRVRRKFDKNNILRMHNSCLGRQILPFTSGSKMPVTTEFLLGNFRINKSSLGCCCAPASGHCSSLVVTPLKPYTMYMRAVTYSFDSAHAPL